MTTDQFLIIALLLGLLALFATDRFRLETMAIGGLALAAVLGLVPLGGIFSGLTSPAVITVIEVLLIVQAISRSHIFDRIGGWLNRRGLRPHWLVIALCAVAACLSSVMNNVAAFSLMLPACFSVMAQNRIPARWIFLPLSYATLMGGLWTSIGTPPNLIASTLLQQATGKPFAFLDFAPAGIAATLCGLLVMAAWLPRSLYVGVPAGEAPEEISPTRRVMTDLVALPRGSGRQTVGQLEGMLEGRVRNVVRAGKRLFPLKPDSIVSDGDHLLVEAHAVRLEACLASGAFAYAGGGENSRGQQIAAVVMPHSVLVGSCVASLDPDNVPGVTILRIEGESGRFEGAFEELPFRVGNLLLLEGEASAIRSFIGYYDLIEVAGNDGAARAATGWMPLLVFALGVSVSALGLLAPDIALGAVVAIFCLMGWLDLRLGLRNLNWSIIILLVAMLPLGTALATTGAAAAIAHGLIGLMPMASAPVAVIVLLTLAMLITPFVNNTATLAILAPVALEVARATGLSPQMLLMAVTMGASLDFLTPFGHHNNMLAYSLGSYRFIEFVKVGWPVSLATGLAGAVALLFYW
ncbi:SLC13 family permease [Rhizobium sp. FY34]|uniref:SLC13 family permease n=1 Tax=Rhizobium sp. FY34 TaxID=2562309 RepID=UPI0010C0B3FE|nr:SLC13 family permease [Rhizobium sp. FY34]